MKPTLVVVTALALAAISATGCSKKSGGASADGTAANAPKGGSCLEDKVGVCTEYAENPMGIAESACTSLVKGTYSKNACSHDNTLGSCASKGDTIYYYFGNSEGPWTEDATENCKTIHDGTFTATAGAAETAKQKAMPTADRIQASCAHDDGSCEDEYGDPIKLGMSKSFCEGGGTWADGKACPSDNLVATCLSSGTARRYYATYLKKNSMSAADLAGLCTGSGLGYSHFYPAPGVSIAPPAKVATGKGKHK
jgi:hypothetical protein